MGKNNLSSSHFSNNPLCSNHDVTHLQLVFVNPNRGNQVVRCWVRDKKEEVICDKARQSINLSILTCIFSWRRIWKDGIRLFGAV